jgi:EmrB/QacA subfamily drug resistance transporter
MPDHANNGTIKKITLIVACTTSFLTPFMTSSINIALPPIGMEFSMDAVMIGWIATAFLLASAIFLVPFGRLADIYGRKRIFTYGIIAYTIFSILCAFSTSAIMLILFRVFQGIGAAMIFSTAYALLTSVFPVHERGKALGVYVAAVYLGLSLGPFLGGILTQHLGWRSIFLINVPLCLMVIVLLFWKLKGEWAEAGGEKFDLAGSVIYAISLTAMMYGFSVLPQVTGIILVAFGILGLVAFIRVELKTSNPVLNISLFKNNRAFAFSNLTALISYCSVFALFFLLSLFLQYTKGYSPQIAGLILVSQSAVMTICAPFVGRLSDKIEPRTLTSIGVSVIFLSFLLLTFLTESTTMVFIIVCLIISGFGQALFESPNLNAVMSSVGKKFFGVAGATMATMRLTGFMLGMGIVMIVFAIFIGRVQITPEYYTSFLISVKMAFIVFAALCFGSIFASIARGKIR